MPDPRLGENPGQVHAGVERAAQQQRNDNHAAMPLGGHGVEGLPHRRRVEIEECQAHIPIGSS